MSGKRPNLSAIIPVYNEEASVTNVIKNLKRSLQKSNIDKFEILAVDDGSTDTSAQILLELKRKKYLNRVFFHETNKGYGSALKSGITASKYPWILIIDADNTYPTQPIPYLIKNIGQFDMIVGARTSKKAKVPKTRIIPKKILLLVANLLTGEKIPDLNSGMRIFSKDLAYNFWHLLPDRFSFTSTITLASHLKKHHVKYIPITYQKRIGKSSIKPSDFIYFTALIIRMVVYFNPLKFFFWPGIIFTSAGGSWLVYTILSQQDITDSGLLLFLLGVQTAFFGLIADLIVKTRESHEKNYDKIIKSKK